jgi:hypothetical protein
MTNSGVQPQRRIDGIIGAWQARTVSLIWVLSIPRR